MTTHISIHQDQMSDTGVIMTRINADIDAIIARINVVVRQELETALRDLAERYRYLEETHDKMAKIIFANPLQRISELETNLTAMAVALATLSDDHDEEEEEVQTAPVPLTRGEMVYNK